MSLLLALFAPVLGALVYGLERIVRARMQRRAGPPLLQPFYDMAKLLDKRLMMVHPLHVSLGVLHFIVLWVAVAMLFLGGHLLLILFVHLFALLALVMAGYSVRSPYSHVGANRELLALLAYEPILVLTAVGFYLTTGSFYVEDILAQSPQLGPLWMCFLALLLVIPIKLKQSPFDALEAHQEIVGGVEIEYSGAFYEVLYMAKMVEYLFVYGLVWLFAGDSFVLGALLVGTVFLLVNAVDNATARVRIDHLVRIVALGGIGLASLNLIGVSL